MRCSRFLLTPAILAGLLAVGAFSPRAGAQGTPANAAPAPEFSVLAFGVPPSLPAAPALIALARISYAPGASLPAISFPGPLLGFIEQGSFDVHATGPVEVSHPERGGTPGPGVPGTPGPQFALAPGDTILTPAGTAVAYRNSGSGTASALVAALLPAGTKLPAAYPAGVTFQLLAAGVAADVPAASALVLGRDTLPPGANEPPTDPNRGPLLAYVERGSIEYTLAKGSAQVSRGSVSGTPMPSGAATPVGTEPITLNPGDSVVEQTGTVSGERNTGSEPASALIFFLEPPMYRGTPTS